MGGAPEVYCKEAHDSWGRFGHWYASAASGGKKYIPFDLHLALVAAAYEKAAKTTPEDRDTIVESGYALLQAHVRGGARGQTFTEWDSIESHIVQAYSNRIRALTPADAQAALEAVKREARNEALREALAIAGNQVKAAHTDEAQVYCNKTYDDIEAILALMGEDD